VQITVACANGTTRGESTGAPNRRRNYGGSSSNTPRLIQVANLRFSKAITRKKFVNLSMSSPLHALDSVFLNLAALL